MGARVLSLAEVSNDHAGLVGSKALTLARLTQLGLPVPSGFVVTTEAFRDLFHTNSSYERSVSAYADLEGTVEDLSKAAERIQRLILEVQPPPPIVTEVFRAWEELGADAVVVRSSGTAEDLPNAAFAGQYDSFLDVDRKNLWSAIRSCWASLWSARAAFYRAERGIEASDVGMAVLVQTMVRGRTSGVAFTANPVSGNRKEIVVNRASGTGEAIVGGTVTPEHAVLRKDSTPLDATLVQIQSLSMRIEAALGSPQDIEWVEHEGTVYIVQSRPITTFREVSSIEVGATGALKNRLTELLFEYFPRAPYPLDRSAVLPLIQETLDMAVAFGLAPPDSSDVLSLDPDGAVRLKPLLPRLRWFTPIGLISGVASALSSLQHDPSSWWRHEWPSFRDEIVGRSARVTPDSSDEALVRELNDAVALLRKMFQARHPYFSGAWLAMGLWPIAARLVFGKDAQNLSFSLLANLEHPTARMNARLRELANSARNNPAILEHLRGSDPRTALGQDVDFARSFHEFLNEFGCRTDVLVPLPTSVPWYDNTSHVLGVIGRMAEIYGVEHDENGSLVVASVLDRIAALGGAWKLSGMRRLLMFLATRNRVVREERDWVIYGYEVAVDSVRRIVRLIAERLYRRNVLRSVREARFLTLDEFRGLLIASGGRLDSMAVGALVDGRRRARYLSVAQWQAPPKRLRSRKGHIILAGAAASPGRVSGRACIVLSERDFSRMRNGDILVCQATAPAWTPLFAQASAVVSDIGGILSHAAIVAREYAVPAVLGTGSATTVMRDGGMYIVDGSQGVVELIPEGDTRSVAS